MAVSIRPVALYKRQLYAPERTAGNNEHAGGRGAKTTNKRNTMEKDLLAKS